VIAVAVVALALLVAAVVGCGHARARDGEAFAETVAAAGASETVPLYPPFRGDT